MTFPFNLHFLSNPDRTRAVIIEEILKDSLKIEHDIVAIQAICEQLKTAKTQEDMVKYIHQIQTQLSDVVTVSQQVYGDVKELVHYHNP
jgi:hypothetical protein